MTTPAPAGDFEREYGCTEAEWLRWLPSAVHGHAYRSEADRHLRIDIGEGALQLTWNVLPPRRVALLSVPRLRVRFHFSGVDAVARTRFLRAFDLRLQRGGG